MNWKFCAREWILQFEFYIYSLFQRNVSYLIFKETILASFLVCSATVPFALLLGGLQDPETRKYFPDLHYLIRSINTSLTPAYIYFMILTHRLPHSFEHENWRNPISWVLSLGISIKYEFHWWFECGWSICNICVWYRSESHSKSNSCCSFFICNVFKLFSPTWINLKEMNCLYDLLASIKLTENKILWQILGGKKMGRQRASQNMTNPPTQ